MHILTVDCSVMEQQLALEEIVWESFRFKNRYFSDFYH